MKYCLTLYTIFWVATFDAYIAVLCIMHELWGLASLYSTATGCENSITYIL